MIGRQDDRGEGGEGRRGAKPMGTTWQCAVDEFGDWYEGYVARYERDTRAAGEYDTREAAWARETGITTVRGLADTVQPRDRSQEMTMRAVLNGFRELAALVTDSGGRWAVIRGYPEDVLLQLREVTTCHA